ncbi:hypothetical protein [Kutzneria sp. NPDC051319]|uniref:WXG100 family type VII secretion target n=1 Tax=Kutzneria sp. NPDC051319 TaxID=3155047 RepID=UPI0034398C21
MAEGFNVVTEELARCGSRVSSMAGQADSLHGRATAAEVPSRSWGLLGELTTHSKYADLQNQLTDHLSNMTAGLDNAGQRISNTADLYREVDEYHKRQIDQAGGDDKDPGKTDPGQSGGPPDVTPVDGGSRNTNTDQHGGAARVPGGGPVGGGAPSYPPVEHGGLPPKVPDAPVDPGAAPNLGQDGHQNVHSTITVEVEGGGPVTVEVTGEAHEDVEVKGDIQQAGGQTEHIDVHAQTDAAGHAKVALKDPSYEHMSGTLLPDTTEERA